MEFDFKDQARYLKRHLEKENKQNGLSKIGSVQDLSDIKAYKESSRQSIFGKQKQSQDSICGTGLVLSPAEKIEKSSDINSPIVLKQEMIQQSD